MVVGIDVHKRSHAAALFDERGGELGTVSFVNSPAGMRKLRDWLVGNDAADAIVGVESPAGYGRLLVASLEAAGHEVLNVPAWRTHRERRRHGPGKTDPGDAIAVAQVVLRKRAELRSRARSGARARARATRAAAAPTRPRPHPGDPTPARGLESDRPGRRGTRRQLDPPTRAAPPKADQLRRRARRAGR